MELTIKKATHCYFISGVAEHERNRIRAQVAEYCRLKGLGEPTAQSTIIDHRTDQPVFEREGASPMFQWRIHEGETLVVPRYRDLCGIPSDVAPVVNWALQKNIAVHAIDLGIELTAHAGLLKAVASAYEHFEKQVADLHKQMADTAIVHDEALSEVVSLAVTRLTSRFLGIAEEASAIKRDALARVATGNTLEARRAMAARMIAEQQQQIGTG